MPLVLAPLARATPSPALAGPAPTPTTTAPRRSSLPNDLWGFALALGAVLAVKAGWVTSVPW